MNGATVSGPFHVFANYVSLGNTADTDVPAVTDSIFSIVNGHLYPDHDMMLMGVYSSAVTLVRSKIVTPTTRQFGYNYIEPINAALLPPNIPPWRDLFDNPFTLHLEEEVAIQSTDSAAGPNNSYAILWIKNNIQPAPAGDVYTVRATAAITATPQVWTPGNLTLDITLPQGLYAVIGATCESATCIAFRLIFTDQALRPGGLGNQNSGQWVIPRQRRGGWGVWGTFRTFAMPRLEILCNAGDTAQVVYLDLIRVGP